MTSGGEPAPPRGGARDYRGPVRLEYAPEADRAADPGEVVWTWVAYEDDPGVGKDRPVAVVGRTDDHRLVCLMLSSRHHDGDDGWLAIGTGPWDREGRPSWVRVDRPLAVPVAAVRREGAVMPRATYEAVVRALGLPAAATPVPAAHPSPPPQPGRRLFGRLLGRLRNRR